MAFLELVKEGAPATRFAIDGERSIIGRSNDCEVPLDVAAVSRRHAAVLRSEGRFFIEDLESRNGTYLNEQRIVDRTPLRDGDELLICGQTIRFYGDGPSGNSLLEDTTHLADLMDEDTSKPGRASVMATLGLATVGLAICAAVLPATTTVATGPPAGLITAFIAILFAGLWFAFPLSRR